MTPTQHRLRALFRCLLGALVLNAALLSAPALAQVGQSTHHNDAARTGANLSETQLSTANVNMSQFGKLFSYTVDADVYTQPLVVPGVAIPGKGTHTVLYVASNNNSVYAFDADSNQGANAQPLWQVNFNNPAAGVTPVPVADAQTQQNIRNPGPIGVMGTPVVDLGSRTLYLVARTKENAVYVQRLHALDLSTGAEKMGGPKVIQASVPGTGYDSVGGSVTFNPKRQNQRAGLALANGTVYIAWSSHEDIDPYHGWVMGYSAATLTQTGALCVSPDGSKSGIWQSGQPPAIDADGNLYLMTGNGSFDGTRNFGESVLKLSAGLGVLDWFTPDNWLALNNADADLGSSGVLLIPGTTQVIGGGKSGTFFLLDRSHLGHTQSGNGQIAQHFQATSGGHIHGGPVYWNGPSGPWLYVWGEQDFLKAFAYNGTTFFNPTPVSQSTFTAPPGMPGGFLSLSANGAQAGSAILWTALPFSAGAEDAIVSGILRAFDASDLSHELWNSQMNPARDSLGNFAKYVPPTIANGRVYLASFSNQVHVYGLLGSLPAPTGGALTGTSVSSTAAVDLSAVGVADWAHWPGYEHKASGAAQLSDLTVLGGTGTTYSNDLRTLSWSDGLTAPSGSNTQGVFVGGTASGFSLSAPADTATRTLTVYVGGFNSRGMLSAHLSDGSAPDFVDTTFSGAGQYDAVYTLSYHAAAAGQQLTVQWTQFSGAGNVTLQGAALAGGGAPPPPPAAPLPPTALTASDGTSTTQVSLAWNASANATSYTVYRSTAAGTQGSAIATLASPGFTDTTALAGTLYYYGVVATGPGGTSALSAQDSGFVSGATAVTQSSVSIVSNLSATSTAGQTVTFTVTVSGNSPAGSITCADGANTFAQTVLLTNSSASCATSLSTLGPHLITVTYSGDPNNSPGTGTFTQTVQPAPMDSSNSSAAGASSGGGGGGCTVNRTGTADWTFLFMLAVAGLYRLHRRHPSSLRRQGYR
jgi:Bacterial Ig-like domain (group 3)